MADNIQALLFPLPLLPHIWEVDKKTHVLPPLALGKNLDHANLGQCEAKDPSPQPYLLTIINLSQSPLSALSSPFQIYLGTCPAVPKKSHIMWIIKLSYPLGLHHPSWHQKQFHVGGPSCSSGMPTKYSTTYYTIHTTTLPHHTFLTPSLLPNGLYFHQGRMMSLCLKWGVLSAGQDCMSPN